VSRAVSGARTPLGSAPPVPEPPATVDVRPIPSASVAPTETEPARVVPSKPMTRPTGLTAAQAIAAAGKEWGMNLTDPSAGVSVTARKMRWGDVRYSMPGDMGGLVSNSTLVWVVTVDGLSIPSSGAAHPPSGTPAPAPKPHTQENIVIDAKTGAFVMAYSYK